MSLAIGLSRAPGSPSDDPANVSSGKAKGTESAVPFEMFLDDRTDADQARNHDVCDPVMPENTPAARPSDEPSPPPSAFDAHSHTGSEPVDQEGPAELSSSLVDETDDEKIAEWSSLLSIAHVDLRERIQVVDATLGETVESSKADPPTVLSSSDRQPPAGIRAQVAARPPQMPGTAWIGSTEESADVGAPFSADQAGESLAQGGRHSASALTTAPERSLTLARGDNGLADAAIRARLKDWFGRRDRAALPRNDPNDIPANHTGPVARTLANALSLASVGDVASPDAARPQRSGQTAASTLVVDSFRLPGAAAASDTGADPDQHRTMTPSDRSSLLPARAFHLVQPVTRFETTLGRAQASSDAGVVTLPDEANVASSIVQTMRLQMRDGIGTAVVNLEPEYLGAVRIALRVEGGVVTATLHAQNPQVRAWAEANEPLLRQGLADQGLSLDRLLVSEERVSEERPSSGRRRPSEQEPAPHRQPRGAESTTFEVVV